MEVSTRPITSPAPGPRLFDGKPSFSIAPTAAQLRFLLFILASHEASAPVFHEVKVPLALVYPDPQPEGYARAARTLFGAKIPLLVINEVNAAGQLVRRGSYCMMPLLSCLSYREGEQHVQGKLNDALLDYLPHLLSLLPTGGYAFPALPFPPLQLAA